MNYTIEDISSLGLDSDQLQRVNTSLQRVEKGTEEVFETPIGKSLTSEELLAGWDSVFNANAHKLDPDLVSHETFNRTMYGPRSKAKPWSDRRESLEAYFEPYAGEADLETMFQDKSGVLLLPLDIVNAAKRLRPSTSSGLPFMKKKRLVLNQVTKKFNELYEANYPYMLFTRTQEMGKTRNVWGEPIVDSLQQMRVFAPYLTSQRKKKWRSSLISPDATDLTVTNLFNWVGANNGVLLSVDFSAYDSTIKPPSIITYGNHVAKSFQRKHHAMIHEIFRRVATKSILTPDGIWSGQHAHPSGEMFTIELNSEVMKRCIDDLINFDVQATITGDDGLFAVRPDQVDQVHDRFRSFGFKVNDQKSTVSNKYTTYLQNYYSKSYSRDGILRRVYPTYRALLRIRFQERFAGFEDFDMQGSDYYAIRTISILENCKYHPLYKDLVKYVLSKDKYNLSFTRKGLAQYIDMLDQVKGSQDVMNNQLSDNYKGIRNFTTVRLIRELA
jgi:hypothetical protein